MAQDVPHIIARRNPKTCQWEIVSASGVWIVGARCDPESGSSSTSVKHDSSPSPSSSVKHDSSPSSGRSESPDSGSTPVPPQPPSSESNNSSNSHHSSSSGSSRSSSSSSGSSGSSGSSDSSSFSSSDSPSCQCGCCYCDGTGFVFDGGFLNNGDALIWCAGGDKSNCDPCLEKCKTVPED